VHSLSVISESRRETRGRGNGEPGRAFRAARGVFATLVCAFAVFAAGCHRPSNISYYGLAWVTVSSEPGGALATSLVGAGSPLRYDFTNYIITIDSIVLTRNDGQQFSALATPEIVDFAHLQQNAELWGTATIPDGTYTSATITLDYTSVAAGGSSVITAMINGVATQATVTDTAGNTGANMTSFAEVVTFDPANPLVVTPTYASTSATRLNINLDLGASGYLTYSGTTLTYVANPFMTIGILPSDNKLIRIRGALINTNDSITTGGSTGTYSVYVRPFHDEVDNLGALSLFGTADTIFTINGLPYTGKAGITALSNLSAGSTLTAAYTTFVPDYNPANQAYAGTFYPVYVVAGSTLEDNYTQGLSGDVISRSGNTLTLRDSTLFINEEEVFYSVLADTTVTLGTGTLVTADDTTLTGLNSNSIGVGQHIEARGLWNGELTTGVGLDATGTSATNTGSVRLINTQLYGSLTSTATGSLTMNVTDINNWPASNFTFTGNGTSAAGTPVASSFIVNTGSLALPADLVAGAPAYVNGLVTPFGSAPPDFTATAVNSQASVQVAGGSLTAAGTQSCGLGSQVCQPATLRVVYNYGVGTAAPFASLSAAGFTLDLTNTELVMALVRIGPEVIDLKTLSTNLTLVPTTLPNTSTFGAQYSVGNPVTSTTTIINTTTPPPTALHTYSDFSSFVTGYSSLVSSTNTVLQLAARGVYDGTTNTFTATELDVVL
jgi:hypothetical protein